MRLGADPLTLYSAARPEGRHALALAILKCTLRENLRVIPYTLGAICLRYAQPTLMSQLILYVSDSPTGATARMQGFKLLSATMLIYVGSAVFNGRRDAAKQRVMIAVKGSLIGILHDKTLQCNEDGRFAITLMSDDMEDLRMAFGRAHVIWSSFLSLSLGLYLLASRLGWVSLFPLIMVLCKSNHSPRPCLLSAFSYFTLVASQCGKYASRHFFRKHSIWNDATQLRLGLVKTLLEHLRTINLMGYLQAMGSKVQAARENELRAGLVTSQLEVIMAASGSFSNVASPAITLALYTLFARMIGDVALNADRVFACFALIQMVTLSATSIIFNFPEFIAAMAAFDRIQRFLLQPDHKDNRKLPEGQVEHFLAYIYNYQDQPRDIIVGPLYPEDGYAIVVNFATVRYDTDPQPVLKDIDLKIKAGSLVLVVGVTGSGKTTLAKTILGDTKLQSGSVSTSSDHMAFCAQSPWLRDGTIRDIIAGPPGCRVADEDWYQRVLHACDLRFDLLGLPKGDRTLVTHEGISLSEDQRQRLVPSINDKKALARAVFSRLDILILDDVLRALDEETSSRVVRRLLGPAGLLRELNKTVVLITDSRDLLQHSDLIVILNPDGSICEQGTWDEPKVQARYNELSLHLEIDSHQEEYKKGLQQINTPRSSNYEQSTNLFRKPADSSTYTQYVAAIGWYRVLVTIFIFLSSTVFAMLVQNWLRLWTESDESSKRATFYLGVYFVLAFGHWVSLTGIGTVEFLVVPTSGRALHDQLLTTVIKAPLSFITCTNIGTALSRFSQDIRQADRNLPREVAALGSQMFKLLAQIILLCMSQAYNLVALPVLAIVVYVIQRMYIVTSRQTKRLSMEANFLPNNSFVETVQGIATVRAFGWENAYALDNSRALDAAQIPSYTLHSLDQWLGFVMDLIVAGVALVNVAFIVTFKGSMTAGDVGISMNVILNLNMVLMITVQSWENADTSLSVISRIRNFVLTVAPESQPKQEHPSPESWPSSGEIDINSAVFDYTNTGEQPSASDHALTDVSFKVAPGYKIAVCGPTGNRKPSLLFAFLQMIDLFEGTITIDGLDLSSIARDFIRSRMITIPQDSFIIPSDSVRGNLDVEGIATDKRIVETLKKVHLWSSLESRAMDAGLSPTFYLDLPMKAWPLSEDQLQLTSLARALLLRSSRGKIVVFEESTSSVDTETTRLIQQVIDEEFRGYTIIVVAHRLDTIADSDSIIVMDKGRIVQVGSFDVLRQNEGAFRSFLDSESEV
ncbi:ABC transporter transmembrane domain type 1 [Penicillium robsamsonii]|uniref:ABC transporter transmembrane domain type 1 n=1 Tax=Penicillium robsamsonii TaxID=1792511 RepID=UPI002549BBF5|nr:ABC transporter transmembrane domain type 1 [Penicillium robsamsonii]KAJ5823864.1 ABC transporter transmembrane domain type 1 [Penicillium robsamsonii]